MLGCRDETRVEDLGIRTFLDQVRAFLQEAFHAATVLATRLVAEALEDPFEALGVLAGLSLVLLERPLELGAGGSADELGHRLEDLVFRAVEVLQGFYVQLLE